METKEVKASGLQGKMRAQQEKYRLESVKVLADMLGVVALAKKRLDWEHQVTKREQALVKVEQKLEATSSATLSAQHSSLEGVDEARKCREKLEDAEERLGVAQDATNKACDDANVAKEEASKFENDFVVEVERRRDEVVELTKQLCRQCASAAAGSKKLAAVHAELESYKAKSDSLDEGV